jgi:hypothetical protein
VIIDLVMKLHNLLIIYRWIAYPSHNFQLHDGDNFNVENGRILRILIGEGCMETETVMS